MNTVIIIFIAWAISAYGAFVALCYLSKFNEENDDTYSNHPTDNGAVCDDPEDISR